MKELEGSVVTTAADIARDTVRAATPDAPPLIREITRAVFDGKRRINAEVILFDGQTAKLRLERWTHGEMPQICDECGAQLTAEEKLYYDGNCEECESDMHERIAAWREGAADPELDEMFGGKPKVSQ